MPDYLATYLRESSLRGHRPATTDLKRKVLGNLKAAVGPLLAATDQQLIDWYATHARKSQATLCSYGACIRSFYKWAVDRDLIQRDPSRMLPIPRAPRRQPRPMPLADLVEALRQAPDHRIKAWVVLGAFAGLRAGEIARLRREDVLDRQAPTVIGVHNGKGGRDRNVVVPQVVIDALGPFLHLRGPLFGVVPATVTMYMRAYFKSLGMPYTCHSLRHTFATGLLRVSGDLRMVQQQCGHASPVTTAGYASPSLESAISAASAYSTAVLAAA